MTNEERVFIVTAARSGSTLLAAILADAGADFDMTIPQQWNRSGGDIEHPELWRALRYFCAAEAISVGRPRFGIARMRWVAYRSLAKKRLRAGLAHAHFAKVYGAHKLVRLAFKVGYFPTVILSFRRFEDQALSLGLMYSHANWEFLRENYYNIYCNGIWLLNTFGGCVVSYEKLVDPDDCSWAGPLSRATNLPAAAILAARNRRVREISAPIGSMEIDRRARRIFDTMQAMDGKLIPPSHQALRSWETHPARTRERNRSGPAAIAIPGSRSRPEIDLQARTKPLMLTAEKR